MAYKNQKTINDTIKQPCDKDHYYTVINLNAMSSAARDLTAGEFKLWCYFAKNKAGYAFDLSSKAVLQEWGIKKDQYDKAVEGLIEKGYLEKQEVATMPGETVPLYYVFREVPCG